jgi:hypothetical protein
LHLKLASPTKIFNSSSLGILWDNPTSFKSPSIPIQRSFYFLESWKNSIIPWLRRSSTLFCSSPLSLILDWILQSKSSPTPYTSKINISWFPIPMNNPKS